jgi:hypothetical protein
VKPDRVYWMEGGMPEHYLQRFLDHATLSTTSRYLKTTTQGMHQVLQQFEERCICKKFASDTESGRKSGSASAEGVVGITPVS